uniref:Uncharacterized protein n=1 Tax=Cacopsylla melanoneura TaxID=428564 RepID=A0A8D8VKU7_9HEMI
MEESNGKKRRADPTAYPRNARKQAKLKGQAQEQEPHVLSLAIDYMQNLCLPNIPVQEIFYRRQLTVNVFCISNIKDKNAAIYIYHEGNARKSPDKVCSFLHDYLKNVPDKFTEFRLFSDNCAGQNKNQTLCRYLLSLTDTGRFKKVKQYLSYYRILVVQILQKTYCIE